MTCYLENDITISTLVADISNNSFKYAVNQKDDIQKYFLISKDCPDYKRMQQYGPVIAAGSKEAYLLLMLSEAFICSIWELDRFYYNMDFINATCRFKQIFLQHGIIKDELFKWTNDYLYDFFVYLTSVPAEYESIIRNPNYGYGEDVVKMTGLPRYDYLVDKRNLIFLNT